ncbi:MAG: hypothetical protein LBI42_06615 [Chitinispirillales bacterium]|jgi:hypothetical protein|nr:hypothetical protein [Chitinispirillales bacterium]
MRQISTENVENGSVCAEDICSPSGNVLVPRGTAVSAALGKRLRNWGITHIYIEGEETPPQDIDTCAALPGSEIGSALVEKFSGILSNTRMKKIFDAVCQHKLRNGGV